MPLHQIVDVFKECILFNKEIKHSLQSRIKLFSLFLYKQDQAQRETKDI